MGETSGAFQVFLFVFHIHVLTFCDSLTKWDWPVNLCRAQCLAFDDKVWYIHQCPGDEDFWKWEINCQSTTGFCYGSCFKEGNIQLLGPMVAIPVVPDVTLYRNEGSKTKLVWDLYPENELDTIVYVVERRIGTNGEWQLLDEVISKGSYTVEEEVKDCQNYVFRVASVSQYGTRGFSQNIGLLPIPDVSFEQTAMHYDKYSKEFKSVIQCDMRVPLGYNISSVKCQWKPKFTIRCPDLQSVQPILEEYKPSEGRTFLLRIHAAGFGCNFTAQVRAYSSCGDYSTWTNVQIDLSDCESLADFPCPEEVSPPGIVYGVEVVHDTKNGLMHAQWKEPNDTGTHGVATYCVQWGHCRPMPMFGGQNTLHPINTTHTISPEIEIPVEKSGGKYGVQILALGPGQICTEHDLALLRVFCAHTIHIHHLPTLPVQEKGHGVLIKEEPEKGLKILRYPHTPILEVIWEAPKFRDMQTAIKQYALRWGPLQKHSSSENTVIDVENSTFISGGGKRHKT